jgi:type IV secretory pathway VirB2 component (pilin)
MRRIVETVVETYRRVPGAWALAVAAVASLCLATIAGMAGWRCRDVFLRPGKQQR